MTDCTYQPSLTSKTRRELAGIALSGLKHQEPNESSLRGRVLAMYLFMYSRVEGG